MKLKRESATRLRECLNALALATEHDVFRCEIVSSRGRLRIIVTSSRESREEPIAGLIAAHLGQYLSTGGDK